MWDFPPVFPLTDLWWLLMVQTKQGLLLASWISSNFTPVLSSVDDTRVQLKSSTTSQISGNDYINASFIKVKFVLHYCMMFLLDFWLLFGITDSTLKWGLKLAGYWGQQSCKIYFHSRTTSQDIRGFLGNGFPKSMSCDCYAHTVR